MTTWQEYRRDDRVWKIRQDGEWFYTEHGKLDGAMQNTSDRPGPKGKVDSKAFVSAEDNAKFNVERQIRKKTESGYVLFDPTQAMGESTTEPGTIDFSKRLPKNFTAYKPQTSIEPAALEKLFHEKKARLTRKYDGQSFISCKHTYGWEIYTRRMDIFTDKFPVQVAQLNTLSFDVGTILQGEMVCFGNNRVESFKDISRYCRSDAETARKLVENKEVVEPTYLLFDVLFHNGEACNNTTYDNRRKLYADVNTDNIMPVDLQDVSPSNWEETAKANGWEGYVVNDGSSTPKDKFFSFDGDAKRPKGSYKLKPVYTEDVVVYAGVLGNGKRLGKVGSVLVKQKHPDTKEWFKCGKVGSGFTEEDIEVVGKLIADLNLPIYEDDKKDKSDLNDYGFTVELEYSERQPGTNKFRFPVFMRIRDNSDKHPTECVAQRLAAEED